MDWLIDNIEILWIIPIWIIMSYFTQLQIEIWEQEHKDEND